MAKQISQQTFDDVVRENMQEFEMDVEEAVQDAVEQFQSQGVGLDNIVKDASMYTGGDGEKPAVHPVVAALETLSQKLKESPSDGEIIQLLDAVRSECDIDLARRCLAGTNNGNSVLMKAMDKYKDNSEVLKSALKCFCSLVNGQPDVLDDAGTDLLLSLLGTHNSDAGILELVLRAIKLTCVKHEKNRQRYVEKKLVTELSELLSTFKKSPGVVKEVCGCFRVLTLDDDIRVPFGKSYDNAKLIVTEGNALKTILGICEDYKDNKSVLGESFSTLASLAVRDEFCQTVMELGGLNLILKTFQQSLKDKYLTRHVLIVLKALARNDNVKVAIVRAGGVEFVVEALIKHQANPSIAEAACAAITTIVLRNPHHAAKVMACGGHHHVIQAMKIHKTEPQLQKSACMALRNLVAREREYCDQVLALGAEELINEAISKHPICGDEAKAALRDLGCKVELKELWKGENHSIRA
ncbi:armadillo repeat-containing protein 6-like [Gigantopelta aegis]|uniref:armadillo repeat-containing protein 6-like n=1 Tax=Gigantopelta aegis TaxID=1735272 RepID=UPI001B88A90D|nr:armadillo repeat-containing protein 6-like [Gigantopelta aegis]